MAFDAIKAVGQVETELDAEAGVEKLAEKAVTREALEAHAKLVEVPDSELAVAVEAARAEVEALRANPDWQNPERRKAMKVLLREAFVAATGETKPGEETLWLAEQLGFTEVKLEKVTTAPTAVPEVDKPLATPEQVAATKATLAKILAAAEKFSDRAGVGALATRIEGIKTSLEENEGGIPLEKLETYTQQLEGVEKAIKTLEAVKKKLSAEDFVKLMTSPRVQSLFKLDKAADLNTFLEGLVTGMEGKTPEQISTFIETEVNKSSEVNVTNMDRTALIKGVSKSLQTMFKDEYDAWSEQISSGGEKISFQDYLVAQAAGDEGKQRTLAMKLAVANIVEMLRPFLDMLKSLKGGSTDTPDKVETPTDPAQMTPEQRRLAEAAARDAGFDSLEAQQLHNRAQPIEDLLTAVGAPLIKEFSMEEAGTLKFNRAETETYLKANPEFELANLNTLVAGLKELQGEASANTLLAQGWSVATLEALASLPAGTKVEVTDTTIKIGDGLVRNFLDEGIERVLVEEDIKVLNDAMALIAEQKEAASKMKENRNKFVNDIAKKIVTGAKNLGWKDDAYIDAEGDKTFYTKLEGSVIYVDIANGGLDDMGNDVAVLSKDEISLEALGYKDWDQLKVDLELSLRGETIGTLGGGTFVSKLEIN